MTNEELDNIFNDSKDNTDCFAVARERCRKHSIWEKFLTKHPSPWRPVPAFVDLIFEQTGECLWDKDGFAISLEELIAAINGEDQSDD